jgi:hypothetical protein
MGRNGRMGGVFEGFGVRGGGIVGREIRREMELGLR